jgi:hypothetical protein
MNKQLQNSGRKPKPGTSLADTHPELARQAVSTDCSTLTAGSGKSILWSCSRGHQWTARVLNRTINGSGCPYCANKKVLKGFNDLASSFPDLANEAFGWDPTTLTAGSDKKKIWRCSHGHKWSATVKSRTNISQRNGCPICTNKKIQVGTNDLKSTHPLIALEAHQWDPATVTAGSHSKKKWICGLGHEWTTSVRERTLQKSSCPTCGNRKVLAGFNDLATTHPLVAAESLGWDPTTLTAGSDKKKIWRCSHGHKWSATVKSRALTGNSCPYCGGKKVLPGFNDLATTHPLVAAEALGWDPTTLTAGSHKIRKWKCSEGHIWSAAVLNRTSQNPSGCPSCASSGFNPSEPGFLYFLRHDSLWLFQIGITNNPAVRVSKHKRGGWELIQVRGPMDGQTARDLETRILRALRLNGAKFANESGFERFDGWTEAWTQISLQAASIAELLQLQ